jgi:pectinesterase
MYNVLVLLRGIMEQDPLVKGMVDEGMKQRCAISFHKGIDCIVATQYVQHGVKTVWCAQHDEVTGLPAKARAYELPSLSGYESAGLVRLLMELPHPDQRVKEAVTAAMNWFDANRIIGKRVESYINSEGKRDLRLVR